MTECILFWYLEQVLLENEGYRDSSSLETRTNWCVHCFTHACCEK